MHQGGCKVYMDSFLRGIEWIVVHGHLDCFQKPPLGGWLNANMGDYGTPSAHHNC